VLLLAIGTELAQLGSGRTASWIDFGFDCIGIAVGAVTILLLRNKKLSLKTAVMIGGLWLAGLSVVMIPVVIAASAPSKFRRNFPVLGNFEDAWELKLWRPQGEGSPATLTRVQSHVTKGEYALKVESNGSTWAGTYLKMPSGTSWANHDALEFDLYNQGEPFELGIRIDTSDGDRFTSSIQIVNGANSCTTRFSELKHGDTEKSNGNRLTTVDRLVLHFGSSPSEVSIIIDRVELVRIGTSTHP